MLLDYRNLSGFDSAFGIVEGCYLGGSPSTVNTAAALIALDKSIDMTIRNCNFVGAVVGIMGKSSEATYSNAIQMDWRNRRRVH
jgi:hypothetical protein